METMRGRLEEDHRNARLLAEALKACPGVTLTPPETNIVVAVLERQEAPAAVADLAERGVLAVAMDARTLRFVTHKDVSRADCRRAAKVIQHVLG